MVEFKKIQKFSEKEFELIKITDDVRDFVAHSKVKNGVVFVIVSHTTAGIMADFTTWAYVKPVPSAIRNAAAPIMGGIICPPVEAAASTAPANSGL